MMWESLPSWLHRYDVGVPAVMLHCRHGYTGMMWESLPSWLHRYDVGVTAVMVTQV